MCLPGLTHNTAYLSLRLQRFLPCCTNHAAYDQQLEKVTEFNCTSSVVDSNIRKNLTVSLTSSLSATDIRGGGDAEYHILRLKLMYIIHFLRSSKESCVLEEPVC